MRSLYAALVLIALAVPQRPVPVRRHETDHLTFTTSASTPANSTRRELYLDITPKPRMHVYAPGQAGYIVVTLKIAPDSRFSTAAARFPKPETMLFEPLNERQLVYSKPFRVTQPITLASDRPGSVPVVVKGTLRYQACNDKVCFLPKTVPLEWRLTR